MTWKVMSGHANEAQAFFANVVRAPADPFKTSLAARFGDANSFGIQPGVRATRWNREVGWERGIHERRRRPVARRPFSRGAIRMRRTGHTHAHHPQPVHRDGPGIFMI